MALSSFIPPSSSGEPYRYQELNDFTGGLNLRADQSSLAMNESPDLLNVDVDPRGGVERRDSIEALNSTVLNGDVLLITGHHETASGTNQILVAAKNGTDTELWFGTGSDFALINDGNPTLLLTGTEPPTAVTFNDSTYISNGEFFDTDKSAVRWRGSNSATALTPDLDGTNGHFPLARFTATWGERIWAAYTSEDGSDHASRIRWSKINDAENWTNEHYIDIDIGEHGDHITGILSNGDHLLVFKHNSIYGVFGFDSDTFQVVNLTRVAGSIDGCPPVSTPHGVFFWHARDGLFLLGREGLAYAFERIKPALTNAFMTLDTPPSLMWFDNRLWLSVEFQSGDGHVGDVQSGRRNVFIWDPSLGDGGAWTRYDINAKTLFSYRPPMDTHLGLCATSELSDVTGAAFTRVSKVMQNGDVDDYTGSGATEIYSHYQTHWLSGNRPTFPKRWGKTRTVLLADNKVRVTMDIFKNYQIGSGVSHFKDVEGDASSAVWGTGVWGTSKWVSLGIASIYKFFRWPSAGTAKAISIRFSITPGNINGRGKWGVTSVVGMYRTRRLR